MAEINANDNARQPSWLTILRVALGLVLLYKAFNFIRIQGRAQMLVEQTGIGIFSRNSETFALIVTILSLVCGFFLTVGLFTRLSSIVQIPVLIVAVLFVNFKNMDTNLFELILSIVALLLLILFAIKGSGFLSADEYFRRGAALDRESKKY